MMKPRVEKLTINYQADEAEAILFMYPGNMPTSIGLLEMFIASYTGMEQDTLHVKWNDGVPCIALMNTQYRKGVPLHRYHVVLIVTKPTTRVVAEDIADAILDTRA